MDKALRQKFGLSGKPIKCVKLYRKEMDFDHQETKAHPATAAWVYITADGKLGQAQTYSGNLGRNFNSDSSIYPMPGEKELKKRLKGYEEVTEELPGSECFELVTPGQEDMEGGEETEGTDTTTPEDQAADELVNGTPAAEETPAQ